MNYQPNKYMSTSDVAMRWGVSQRSVQRMVKVGTLRAAKFGTRNLSVLAEDVERHEKQSAIRKK